MPAGNQAEHKLTVKLEEAEWWQKPPVLSCERLHAGGVAEIHLLETHDKMDEMVEWMVPMSTGQVQPHIDGRFISMQVCSASAEVPLVLLSTSLISILSSVVAISVSSKRRPPRPRAPLLSPPLDLQPTKTTQRAAATQKRTADPHSSRIARRAARGRGGTGVGGRRPGASAGMGAAASTLKMGRLEAPARHKPHIDQHQRRALRRSVAKSTSYVNKRNAARPLRSRNGGV